MGRIKEVLISVDRGTVGWVLGILIGAALCLAVMTGREAVQTYRAQAQVLEIISQQHALMWNAIGPSIVRQQQARQAQQPPAEADTEAPADEPAGD